MRCPRCEGETPEGKAFCANCGAALAASCATCGAELVAGKAFCPDCGSSVGAAQPRTDERRPRAVEQSAERRLCSVLFVDLVGFTPLAEKADPETVHDLLAQYFERAGSIIASYGGTVEKFIGDAVMAVWGAPVANEDDAERAVRAGLDVVAAVGELGRSSGRDGLAARGGIVTGEVAVTVGRVAEGMVTGDTVNVASRFQGAADPGTVLVDEATWRAASGAIAFVAVPELTLKGKSEAQPAWQAQRVVGQRKGLGRPERLEPPFVGRDDELALVKDLLQATDRERRARLVSVMGVPGIGKSRLAWEFLKYVDGLAETVYWHQGRSASYGAGVTFGALGEMVRMRAGITDAEDAADARVKLGECVDEHVEDVEERRWIEPCLAHLLGLAEAPTADRDELFSAWRTFFERIATRGLTVLVFEDLQWADPGLIDFIESILEWSRTHPIMVVTLARPELRDVRSDWGVEQRSFTSLHLDPLSDDDMTALLDGFVHGLPPDVAQHVRERSEGVPLYAVETVRMLVDRGVLVAEDGVYHVHGELTALEIPETLHALVASRLDALPTGERALLQDAAVLGATFRPETLAIVHGASSDALDPMLRDLVRKEFLRLDSDPRSPERGQYGFVQGVIGDVALGMLSRRDRSAKHLAVARHCESLDDEELTAIVAAQYASAFRAAPEGEDTTRLAASASTWLAKAGERAFSLGSPEQALNLYDQALGVTSARPRRAALLEAAAEAANRCGEIDRARSLATDAIDAFGVLEDRVGAARSSWLLSASYANERRYSESVDIAQRAYSSLSDDDSLEARARLATGIAGAYGQGLDVAKGLAWAEIALTHAEALGDTAQVASALGARASALFNLGRHREAVMLARGMGQLAAEAGALREQASALMGLGLFTLPDDPRASVRASMQSVEIFHRIGLRSMEVLNLLNAAETSITIGDLVAARHFVDDVETSDARFSSWRTMLLAMLDAIGGDAAAAMAALEPMAAFWDQPEFVSGSTTYLLVRSFVELCAGELAAARASAARALELDPAGINAPSAINVLGRAAIWLRDLDGARSVLAAARPLRGRWIAAVLQTFEAGIVALDGDLDGSAEQYATAFDAWRLLDCPLELALAELDLVQLLGPDHPAAVAGKEAEDIFEQLGAVPYLARLAAARGDDDSR